ncbi:hypothetical protein ONZ45_g6783 [Pleurotus djamor]|nr:hypothetical protein ONZ45_g6783 [Pleurotus djamor]
MATSPADYTNWPSGSSLSRPRSRLTSSLSNAMGDAHISSHPRTGASPAPRDDFPNMGWLPSQPQQQIASGHHDVYPVVPGLVPSHDDPGQYINYTSTYRNVSPESLSPQSPPFTPSPSAYDYHFSQSHSPMSASLHPPSDAEAEIQNLRRKLHEAQNQKALAEERSRQLGIQVQHLNRSMSSSSSAMLGLPSLSAPAPTQSFQKSWDLRTQARIRLYCSLNRAGNALCAWHDSRRERRAYPPRMAPPGYLNCGCTYEQALFEESLSRHNVGCYLPGETVRMDPALRNPLLKLLEERFGYRDGDFERDPMTGMWVQGEGHECWERKLQAGPANSRKARSG